MDRKKAIPLIILIAFILILEGVFAVPRDFASVISPVSRGETQQIEVWLSPVSQEGARKFIIDAASPEGKEFFDLMEASQYRKTMSPQSNHEITLDYIVDITLTEADGTMARLSFDGDQAPINTHSGTYAAVGGQDFLQAVLNFLLETEAAQTAA